MGSTRDKILKAARFLFNSRGVAKVSQRTISDHIAISPGNLTYHFKKRDDLIEALYFELVEAMNESFKMAEDKEVTLELMMNLTKAIHKNCYDNRFFMIDFIQILRSNPKIKKHYAALSETRNQQSQMMIERLIEKGIVRQAELPNEYDFLFKRMQLFGDFWIASVGTTPEDIMLKHTRVYTEIFMQAIYPYLTEKGKKEFKVLMGYK